MSQDGGRDGTVRHIRQDLHAWIEDHLPGLHRATHDSTLWYGVMQKCGAYVENLLRATAERFVLVLGPAGDAAVMTVGGGKPLAKFTLGQLTKLLQALEEPIIDLMTKEECLPTLPRPLIGKAGVELMNSVSRLRNDFAHNRWQADRSAELTVMFLEQAGKLCQTPIISLAVAIEDAA